MLQVAANGIARATAHDRPQDHRLYRPHSGGLAAIDSAIDEEVLLHSRHNLRIREFVSGLNIDGAVGQRFGSA